MNHLIKQKNISKMKTFYFLETGKKKKKLNIFKI